MSYIRNLAGQTAVYGMGIVIPRVLNYLLLTPFYTRVFTRQEYGVITELYAYVVFLIVILTYGMETGFFRFAKKENEHDVFKTSLISLLVTSLIFIIFISVFNNNIASIIGYEKNASYINLLGYIVAIDAFTSIPFAKIRFKNKVRRYAIIRIVEVSVNIFFNWFFIFYCHNNYRDSNVLQIIYDPEFRVGYVLIANFLASGIKLLLLLPEIFEIRGNFKPGLLKTILVYSLPLLVAGLAGTVNEAIDRILLKFRLPEDLNALEQLGVYGANYKLAVLMTLFIQMFRYAAEPFFFSKMNDKNAKEIYAEVLNYFVFFCMVIFLFVTLFMDYFKIFIGKDFRIGIGIVPVILIANLFMGIYYNLSVWYKIKNKTLIGAYIVIFGAFLTFIINYVFIPEYGYYASAWGHFISYLVMICVSFLIGRKFYKVPYDIGKVILYILVGVGIFILFYNININNSLLQNILKVLFLAAYSGWFLYKEKVLKKYF